MFFFTIYFGSYHIITQIEPWLSNYLQWEEDIKPPKDTIDELSKNKGLFRVYSGLIAEIGIISHPKVCICLGSEE